MVDPCPPVVVPLVPLEPLDGGVQSGGGVHVPFSGFEPFSPFGPFSPFWQEIAPISKKVNTSILIVQEWRQNCCTSGFYGKVAFPRYTGLFRPKAFGLHEVW